MADLNRRKMMWLGRTLHECVDWNISSRTHGWFSRRRTLHECVDWNNRLICWCRNWTKSHSTRVRGLKFREENEGLKVENVALYTSAWIEMICHSLIYTLIIVALLVSAWIEIRIPSSKTSLAQRSHSSWVRGLKSDRLNFETASWASRTPRECVDWNGNPL